VQRCMFRGAGALQMFRGAGSRSAEEQVQRCQSAEVQVKRHSSAEVQVQGSAGCSSGAEVHIQRCCRGAHTEVLGFTLQMFRRAELQRGRHHGGAEVQGSSCRDAGE